MTVDTEVLEACADILDQASNVTLASTANQIAHLSYLAAPEQERVEVRHEDGTVSLEWETTECVDCGEEIEEGRLELAKIRCKRCQEILEKKRRGNFRVRQ